MNSFFVFNHLFSMLWLELKVIKYHTWKTALKKSPKRIAKGEALEVTVTTG